MCRKYWRVLWALPCLSGPVHAEVALDGSLGTAGAMALSGPDYQITEDMGEQKGNNLFHSFSVFGLTPLESATFSGPEEVEHIIGRVTGGSSSRVEGTLRTTISGAQLWMFNPAGWEQLGAVEVSGGLGSAPAQALRLKDGGLFNADLASESLLTSAPPQAFLGLRVPVPEDFEENWHESGEESEVDEDLETNVGGVYMDIRRHGLQVQPNACGDEMNNSSFIVTRYRGAPVAPESWQASSLPPLSFESVPESGHEPVARSNNVRLACSSAGCGFWESLPN